jgi:manganese-dependent inorganic pyrophosphatase
VTRDVKEYDAGGGRTLRIAQVETVGKGLAGREAELLRALETVRAHEGDVVAALMVTDIMARGTELYVSGERSVVARAFGGGVDGGRIELPGVMSRKKQVAPPLLAALAGGG